MVFPRLRESITVNTDNASKIIDFISNPKTNGISNIIQTTETAGIVNPTLANADPNPKLIDVKNLEEQNDGNNVNLDTQMSEMSKNKILFDAIQSSIKRDSRLFRSVIESSAKN